MSPRTMKDTMLILKLVETLRGTEITNRTFMRTRPSTLKPIKARVRAVLRTLRDEKRIEIVRIQPAFPNRVGMETNEYVMRVPENFSASEAFEVFGAEVEEQIEPATNFIERSSPFIDRVKKHRRTNAPKDGPTDTFRQIIPLLREAGRLGKLYPLPSVLVTASSDGYVQAAHALHGKNGIAVKNIKHNERFHSELSNGVLGGYIVKKGQP